MIAFSAVGIVVLAVVGALLVQSSSSAADAQGTGGSATPPPSIVSSPSTTVVPETGSGPAPFSVSSATPSAAAQLADLETADAVSVNRLEGYWVAQISSKRDGLVADGIVYDDAAILAVHQRLAARFPDTVLFESDRFASYRSSGFWVSAVAIPYSTAAEANAWCDAAGLSADDCFAKRLTQSTSGQNSVQR